MGHKDVVDYSAYLSEMLLNTKKQTLLECLPNQADSVSGILCHRCPCSYRSIFAVIVVT